MDLNKMKQTRLIEQAGIEFERDENDKLVCFFSYKIYKNSENPNKEMRFSSKDRVEPISVCEIYLSNN